jgi:hypothetical protein
MKRRNVKENKRILEDTSIFRYDNDYSINTNVSRRGVSNTPSIIKLKQR